MLWLIEPHADDVFLSLHQHIVGRWNDKQKTIVTVYANKKREREAKAYAEAVGCQHVCLRGIESGNMSLPSGEIPEVAIESFIKSLVSRDTIVLPLGLQHPEHITTSKLISRGMPYTLWYYLDTPAYAKKKLDEELNWAVRNHSIISIAQVSARKWKYASYFKTQSLFFHYNPPEKLPKTELVINALTAY